MSRYVLYQEIARAIPVEVFAREIEWLPVYPDPSFPEPEIESGFWAGLLDQALFAREIDWFQADLQPVFLELQPEAAAIALPVVLPEVPVERMDWFQQASEPIWPELAVDPGGIVIGILLAELFPREIEWFQRASEPVFPDPPVEKGFWSGILDESLFVEAVDLASWLPRTEVPPEDIQRFLPALWGTGHVYPIGIGADTQIFPWQIGGPLPASAGRDLFPHLPRTPEIVRQGQDFERLSRVTDALATVRLKTSASVLLDAQNELVVNPDSEYSGLEVRTGGLAATHVGPSFTFIGWSSDPPIPVPGRAVMWLSDGTGFGDAGDLCIKINMGGVEKKTILADFSVL